MQWLPDYNNLNAFVSLQGDLKTPGSQRYLLFTQWASIRKSLKFQPLDAVKEYFGVKIGLYFAWLGFYTNMLIPAAALGFCCFLYGVFTLYTNQHRFVDKINNTN